MHQRLLEHLTTAVLLLDGKLRVRWMNPAAEALLAVSLSRVKGISLDTLLGDDSIDEVLAKARDAFHPYTQREARITPLINSEPLTVDYTVTPLSDDELLLEVEPRDRLMQISREEALTTRQETIKVLARGLAHEVKNPLGGIRGAAQLLERDLDDPALREYTYIIVEEVDRLRDLVDSMLGPNYIVKHEPLNIHKVLERVRALLIAEHPSVLISRDYDPSLPDLSGDESQMIQAVLNVARNAVQAMNDAQTPEPTLILRTRSRRQFTLGAERHRLVSEVAVIDNGPGVPDTLQETLFYPMVSGRSEGSGLGLSIAQSILQQHQGLIECESRPGHTEFRLLIPMILLSPEKRHD
ncbi:nitrogen regulation protein NR(II) [Halovibrio sp. HP20-50]|uniref:nitrogen regulation protein NR(II) n=1 Tax=Halovibrio sp. HP20-59 TaxID=3080275 RepID=UPI00294B57BA|nr:nitrogen regulation protein NR(II) [Halovibrio sp. HP20-59]MEA2119714.1 nitrogen regulation protein NR(II) [Halovibrio sp. HP20-59]